MSLRAISRLATRAVAQRAISRMSVRALSVYSDKEKAEEAIYIKREEERLLKNLMAKLKAKETKGKDELLQILGPNKLPDDVIQKLLDWKYHE